MMGGSCGTKYLDALMFIAKIITGDKIDKKSDKACGTQHTLKL